MLLLRFLQGYFHGFLLGFFQRFLERTLSYPTYISSGITPRIISKVSSISHPEYSLDFFRFPAKIFAGFFQRFLQNLDSFKDFYRILPIYRQVFFLHDFFRIGPRLSSNMQLLQSIYGMSHDFFSGVSRILFKHAFSYCLHKEFRLDFCRNFSTKRRMRERHNKKEMNSYVCQAPCQYTMIPPPSFIFFPICVYIICILFYFFIISSSCLNITFNFALIYFILSYSYFFIIFFLNFTSFYFIYCSLLHILLFLFQTTQILFPFYVRE